jgi:adenylyltransferase/sulfurtransferase
MPQQLRIPTHYYVYSDPPDRDGHETLHFVSGHRRIRLRGHSFREFVQRVVPLLDGGHTLEEVEQRVQDVFSREDLYACLEMLGRQGLLEDAAVSPLPPALDEFLRPQLNFFHEVSPAPEELQQRLRNSRVSILGAGGLGASCALALAAAGVGALDLVDTGRVSTADTYFSPIFDRAAIGASRTGTTERRIAALGVDTLVRSYETSLTTDDEVRRVIEGTTFAVNCLDRGESGLAYKLNRACLSRHIPFTSVQATGVEVVLGPTVEPQRTACFMCYKMRAVACSDNPEAEFAFESFLDRRKHDDSSRAANLAFGVNIAAQLAGLESLKMVTGLAPTARGRLQVLNLLTMAMQTHLVLRKPWCPACFAEWEEASGA